MYKAKIVNFSVYNRTDILKIYKDILYIYSCMLQTQKAPANCLLKTSH